MNCDKTHNWKYSLEITQEYNYLYYNYYICNNCGIIKYSLKENDKEIGFGIIKYKFLININLKSCNEMIIENILL